MSNTVFYIIAVVAIILAIGLMKYVVSCLMRTVILVVTLVGLAFVYYFFVGQYDPEIRDAVDQAVEKYEPHDKSQRH